MKKYKTITDLNSLDDQELIDGFNRLGLDLDLDLTRCFDTYEIRSSLGLE